MCEIVKVHQEFTAELQEATNIIEKMRGASRKDLAIAFGQRLMAVGMAVAFNPNKLNETLRKRLGASPGLL